jgi:quercetin dioxygenase-like cupin family protein
VIACALIRTVAQRLDGLEEESHMKMIGTMAMAALVVGAGVTLQWAGAQKGISRVALQQHDLDVAGLEVVQVRVGFAPGAVAPSHTHPGAEMAYVLEGSLEYRVEGKPPVTLHAGDVLFIPAETAHEATNVGSGDAAELATYIVEMGAPLVESVDGAQ